MPKKRANNTGSVYPDKQRGGSRAQLTLDDGQRIGKRFPVADDSDDERERAENEAYGWLHEQLHLQNKGALVRPSDITLGEWLGDYLELYSKPSVRQRSFERNLSVAKHCNPIADYKLQDLKPNHIQKLYASIPLSGETKRKVHVLLTSALAQAVRNGLLYTNPMDGVIAPKVTREEVEIFAREEVEALLSAAKGHRWYPALLLAAHTGMRLSEVLGLRWQDVDVDGKTVHIRQTLQVGSTGFIFDEPKTKNSRRKISIPANVATILKELRKQYMESLLPKTDKRGLCFTTSVNTPIGPRNFERWWESLQKECCPEYKKLCHRRQQLSGLKQTDTKEFKDVVKKIAEVAKANHKKFHALRHTHATELLAAGVPVIDVSRRLGHAKPSTTLDLYGHAIPGNDQKVAQKAGKLYRLK